MRHLTRKQIRQRNWRNWERMCKAKAAAAPKRDPLRALPRDYSIGNPIFDPGWRSPEEYDRARMVATIIADYEESVVPPADMLGRYSRDGQEVFFPDGSRLLIHDLIDNQRRTAYELLKRRVDPKAIAVMLLRPESWVEALRVEFAL